jgi:hypothetical protein
MPQVSDTDSSITAGKNKLANICIFGQIKANSLMKDIAGQMPNNAKQLCRDLIAAAARVVRPDVTSDLIRDILHYRSRKVRSLLKEWKRSVSAVPQRCSFYSLLMTLFLVANWILHWNNDLSNAKRHY